VTKPASEVEPPLTGSIAEQTRKIIEQTRALVKKTEQSGHYQVAMNGLKAIGANLELLAKLTGELQTGTQIAVGVNVSIERERWNATNIDVLRWASRIMSPQSLGDSNLQKISGLTFEGLHVPRVWPVQVLTRTTLLRKLLRIESCSNSVSRAS
jgi:hypothetical protein